MGGAAVVAAALWYSSVLVNADLRMNRTLEAAAAGDLDQVIKIGSRAADSAEIAGAHHFTFARALVLCSGRLPSVQPNLNQSDYEARQRAASLRRAVDLAAVHARKSLPYSLTPDLNYLLLSYLASVTNDNRGFINLTGHRIDRTVSATFNTCTRGGAAVVKTTFPQATFNISDSRTDDSTCSCP